MTDYFSPDNLVVANEIISRYPRPKSAVIPLLHLAQEQQGWVTDDAMRQIAELTGTTPAEVKGTGSFYEMFKFHPVGKYMVNVCTNIACQILGGEELLAHAEETLGVKAGGTTADGMFTLEDVECVAACTEAPCLQVNYRYRLRVDNEGFDQMIDDIRNDRAPDIPEHGTLATIRQSIPGGRGVTIMAPEEAREAPGWMARNEAESEGGSD